MLLSGRLLPVSEGQGSAPAPAWEPQLLGGQAALPSAAPSSRTAARLPWPREAQRAARCRWGGADRRSEDAAWLMALEPGGTAAFTLERKEGWSPRGEDAARGLQISLEWPLQG